MRTPRKSIPRDTGVPEGLSRLVNRVTQLVAQAAPKAPMGPWPAGLVRNLRGQWSELDAWFGNESYRQEFLRRWPGLYGPAYEAHWRGGRYVNDFFRRPGAVLGRSSKRGLRGLGLDEETPVEALPVEEVATEQPAAQGTSPALMTPGGRPSQRVLQTMRRGAPARILPRVRTAIFRSGMPGLAARILSPMSQGQLAQAQAQAAAASDQGLPMAPGGDDSSLLSSLMASVQAQPIVWGAGIVAAGGLSFFLWRKMRKGVGR